MRFLWLRVEVFLYKRFYFISHALQRNKPATKKNHIFISIFAQF